MKLLAVSDSYGSNEGTIAKYVEDPSLLCWESDEERKHSPHLRGGACQLTDLLENL